MRKYIPVLSIAGSDPSGGAGIQADIKTISALGCYAMTAITSLTAQNTTGVRSIMPSTGAIVADQIDMIMEDIPPMAIKTGMLCNLNVASTVADKLEQYRPDNIVVDPVMISTSGSKLLDDEAIDLIVKRIFPLSTIITPNKSEARVLTGETDPDRQAKILMGMGCRNVLLKGGDSDRKDFKIDYLYLENKHTGIELRADAVNTVNTHGTGCTLSSAIASYLALGYDSEQAVRAAKFYISRALEAGAFVTTGRGHGPVNHFYAPRRLKNFNPNRPK
ncbi:bifunctional hydroxymethylpyrimidine kinase/phosphomethylpyrimidine kinase [Duncaniella freteri]|uniref:bifunctional hydroxymethylpyrimidine kinase/phosphomethylpyrimidine kinase n=1 Tax=Duncaniella freteri TaxID=2530391 RepID=UPI001367ED9E|nr:bifunctional hydroxymethylpyrimidine kinase/phosphomethylpyrimidine kinase [Duncaniella freteri]NBJ06687.1 bifunctional hydroxymethylpyrimidine kinase/phosphomethylpyrimidine kinase [Alistipes sp. Z76]NCE68780.1 bifunctional hydroxymethylpyrimidine kinase/phosphomethylpyrimidine kinase [Muribaculaceae bacterium M3]